MAGNNSFTKLLAHANGTDYLKSAYAYYKLNDNVASTAVIDSGSGANAGVASGNTDTLVGAGKTPNGKWLQGGIFNGVSSFMTTPDSADWDMFADFTTAYTLDYWLKLDTTGSNQQIWEQSTAIPGTNSRNHLHITNDGRPQWRWTKDVSASQWTLCDSKSASFTHGVWNHITQVVVDGFMAIYVDGVQTAFAWQQNTGTLDGALYIGKSPTQSYFVNGILDEFRMIASNPFTANPNSYSAAPLLIKGEGVDEQDSDTNEGYGGTPIFYETKLDSAYTKLNTTTSLHFNGINSYISVADLTGTNWDIPNSTGGSWTLDFWVKHNTTPSAIELYVNQYVDGSNHWYILNNPSGTLQFYYTVSLGANLQIDATTISDTSWHHLAVVKSGADWGIYVDGIQTDYGNASPDTATAFATSLWLGARDAGPDRYLDGNMEQVQITKGNKFGVVPLPEPFSHMKMENNTDDGSGANAVTNIGTPTYTSGKILNALTLDGSTDALNIDALGSDIFSDTTGTFAVWVYLPGSFPYCFGDTNANAYFGLFNVGGDKLQFTSFEVGTTHIAIRMTNGNFTAGSWHHTVIVQDGVSIKLYLNGVEEEITDLSSDDLGSWLADVTGLDNGRLGCRNNNNSGNHEWWSGQIDDFRYYQGQALTASQVADLYNGSGTGAGTQETYAGFITLPTAVLVNDTIAVPTGAHTSDADTKLLLHMDGDFFDSKDPTSNGDVYTDECTSLTAWTDAGSTTTTQVTFDSKSCFKLDSGIATNQAIISQDVGTFAVARTVASMNLYFDAIGTYANTDHFWFQIHNGTWRALVSFTTEGVYVFDGPASNILVGAGLVVEDVWQQWTFDIDWTNQLVDGYLDGVLVFENADCSLSSASDGLIGFAQDGNTTANRITYVDWVKCGSEGNHIVTPTKVSTGGFEFTSTSSQYVNIDALRTDIISDTIGSFSFWVKPDSITPAATKMFINFGDTDADAQFGIYQSTTSGRMTFSMQESAGNIVYWYLDVLTTDWQHIVITQDGAGVKFYRNGSDITPVSPTGTSGTGNVTKWLSYGSAAWDNGRIGCRSYNSGGNAAFFDGLLDDIRYYKCVLAQADVTTLYAAGVGTENSLVIDSARGSDPNHNAIQTVADAQYDAELLPGYGSYGVFDGSTSYLTSPDSPDWDIYENTDYTVDLWVRHDASGTDVYYMTQREDGLNRWMFKRDSTNVLQFFMRSNSGNQVTMTSLVGITDTDWHHICMVKSGGDSGLYMDGVQQAFNWDMTSDSFAANLVIGYNDGFTSFFAGDMDEIRLQASNYFTATPNSFPAAPLLLYGEGLKKSYAVFNNTNTSFTVPNHTDWQFGTGNFTIDMWVNFVENASGGVFVEQYTSTSPIDWWKVEQTGKQLNMYFANAGTIHAYYVAPNVVTELGRWYHLAFVRNGTEGLIFVDGVSQTLTVNYAFGTSDVGIISSNLQIGLGTYSSRYFEGKMDELRISKGIARWTSNFTPPTAPYYPDSNTQLLLHLDDITATTPDSGNTGHTVTNVSSNVVLRITNDGYGDSPAVPTASAQVVTLEFCHMRMEDNTDVGGGKNAVTNIGTPTYTAGKIENALTLNGTDQALNVDALEVDIASDTAGSISVWVNVDDITSHRTIFCISDGDSVDDSFYIRVNTDGRISASLYRTSGVGWEIASTTVLTIGGGWYHIVVTQDGVSPKMYVNGVEEISFASVANIDYWFNNLTNLSDGRIGCMIWNYSGGGNQRFFDGQIDDFRYYPNNALAQFQIDKIYNDGNGMQDPITALYFDGNSDYLTVTDTSGTDYDVVGSVSDSWTIDLWVKHTDHVGTEMYLEQGYQASGNFNDTWNFLHVHGSGLRFFAENGGVSFVDTGYDGEITDLAWHHISVIKSGQHYGVYKDGVQVCYDLGTGIDTYAYDVTIGAAVHSSTGYHLFDGFMEQVQITKGNKFGRVPAPEPHVHYKMNDDLATTAVVDDGSGSNNGTASTNTTNLSVAGKINECFDLDGTSEYFAANGVATSYVSNTTGTVAIWVNVDDLDTEQLLWIFQPADSHINARYLYGRIGTSGSLIFVCYVGGTDGTRWNFTCDNVTVSPGTWYHITLVQDGISPVVYVNGVNEPWTMNNTNTGVTMWMANSVADAHAFTRFTIGRSTAGSSFTFYVDGKIDDFRYYSNTALTAGQVASIYNDGVGTEGYTGLIVPTVLLTQDTITVPSAPYTPDADTKLLMHFTEDLTTDSSPSVHAITNNNVKLGGPRWGSAALKFSTSSDSVVVPDSSDFDFLGTREGAATIDMQLFHAQYTSIDVAFNQVEDIDNRYYWLSGNTGYGFTAKSDTGNSYTASSPGDSLSLNEWYHLACIRSGSNIGMYVNGVQKGFCWMNWTDTFDGDLVIGKYSLSTSYTWEGNIDEFRVQNDNYFSATPNSFPAAPLLLYPDGAVSDASIDDEPFNSIAAWTDGSTGSATTSQVTFDGRYVAKLDNGAISGDAARLYQDIGTLIGMPRYTLSLTIYFTGIGTKASGNNFYMDTYNGTFRPIFWYCSDGLYIHNTAGTSTLIGDWVQTAIWQAWDFDINFSDKTVDIYLDGTLLISGVDCGWANATSDGSILLYNNNINSTNYITYLDSFKAGITNYPNVGYGDDAVPSGTAGVRDTDFCHMKMQDNTDTGTGANAVTNIGTPTYTSGKIGNALTLDGSTDALNVDALEVDITTDTTGTIALWVKYADHASSSIIFSIGDTDANIFFNVQQHLDHIYISAFNGSVWLYYKKADASSIQGGEWHHVVVVQDGVTPKIYVDGVEEVLTDHVAPTNNGAWFNTIASLDNGRIGCANINSGGNVSFYEGQIDDFRYFQNQALAQFQIDKIYKDGSGTEDSLTALYFDGNSDYLTVTDTSGTDYDMVGNATDSWTIDGWILSNDMALNNQVMEQSDAVPATTDRWWIQLNPTGYLRFSGTSGGVSIFTPATPLQTPTSTIVEDKWYHFAIIKSASHTGIYVDGVQLGHREITTNDTYTGPLVIGRSQAGSNYYFDGYQEQLQITKGNKFGVVPGAEPYAHYKMNDSANNTTITDDGTGANNGTQVATTQNKSVGGAVNEGPFGISSVSGDFSSAYLSALDHADWDLMGSNSDSWTVDCWVRHNGTVSSETYVSQSQASTLVWMLQAIGGPGEVRFYVRNGTDDFTAAGGDVSDGEWHHIAGVKVASSYALYIDGIQITYASFVSTGTLTAPLEIGRRSAAEGYYMDGNIAEVRIQHSNAFSATPVVGLTDTFTVPSYPYVADSNTKLLLHMDGLDDKGATGHTITNTAVSFGAMDFNGTNDTVNLDAWEVATGSDTSGTIALWVKGDLTVAGGYIWSRSIALANTVMSITINSSGRARALAQVGGADQFDLLTSDGVITSNVWTHIVLVQDGTSPKMYINGVDETVSYVGADATYWFNSTAHDKARIGCVNYNSTGNTAFAEVEIDDFRYYQNVALNQSQITDLYNAGAGTEDTFGPDITVPTAILTQDTITPPTAEYSGVTNRARSITVTILS